MKTEGGSGAGDDASRQMSSYVCQGGIDAVSWGPMAAVVGEASQSYSAAREMAARGFLCWHDAATAEEENEG